MAYSTKNATFWIARQLSEDYGVRDIKNPVIWTVLITCSCDQMKWFLYEICYSKKHNANNVALLCTITS